jgi:hypothetical protein
MSTPADTARRANPGFQVGECSHTPAPKWADMTPEQKDKAARGVLRFLDLTALSDRELAARVVNEVWGKCVILGSIEECLLDEMISRFENKSGIKRDDEGRVIPEATHP